MKKIFISHPMLGLSRNEIIEERKRIERKLRNKIEEPFEIIDSFFEDTSSDISPLWYLGKAIEKMSYADIIYFARGWEYARGCVIEHMCAEEYNYFYIEEN